MKAGNHHLSDRMPDVAAGRIRWSVPEQQHLAECPDCAAEWRLVSTASALGSSVERSLDVEAIAGRVRTELGPGPAVRRRVRPEVWLVPLLAAAALILVLWRGPGSEPVPVDQAAATPLLPELETLSVAQLESMLQLLPSEPPADSLWSLEDLTEDEITAVLQNLEG